MIVCMEGPHASEFEDDADAGRPLTSAVPGMNVAEVRRGLQQMRDAWRRHSPSQPLRLSSTIFNGMTMARFGFLFSFGHHKRRHSKSNAAKRVREKIERFALEERDCGEDADLDGEVGEEEEEDGREGNNGGGGDERDRGNSFRRPKRRKLDAPSAQHGDDIAG
jgi:hypothetical protein